MKFSPRLAGCAAAVLFLTLAARADLSRWVQDIAAPSHLQAVFFRLMPLSGGSVEFRRPPKETRPELTKLIAAAPSQADLLALRAHEDELQLDFTAAGEDWKHYVQLASDKIAANLALADFYHRRLQPTDEIAALEVAGRAPAVGPEKFKPVEEQQAWKAYNRIQTLIVDQALPQRLAITEYRAWITRYPTEPAARTQFFDYLLRTRQYAEADQSLADYRKAFPGDAVYPIQAEARLAQARGTQEDALRVYDRNFQAVWPAELVKAYFDLLKTTHGLRRFLEQARARIAAEPGAIDPAARVFDYYQQQGNASGALRALYEYRQRKTSFTADELRTLGKLFERANHADDAARSYYALYNLAGSGNQENSLAAIANLLLASPEQPISLGAGDLSLYRDIATMDPGPGFLNGILSLLFNWSAPQWAYATENQASLAYFHRAKAAELISVFDQRFPNSTARADLHAKLIAAYVVYGDDAGVLRAGREFLTQFPQAPQHVEVALEMADAYSRGNQMRDEFAIYDDLLKELSANADHVPLGEKAIIRTAPPPPPVPGQQQQVEAKSPARSPEYARILDRYIGRLAALKRPQDALALYRREIGRNPNDPGLYERLAGFLEQNRMGAEVEQVYRKAMAQFQDPTWSHKLARWYLRRKQTAQFDALTREVVKIFSGTELEAYLRDTGTPLAPVLFRQVNLYAHERFPYELQFVRNLLTAYSNRATVDPAAREALLRQYWYYAPDLRDRFFELLSRTGKLKTELAGLPKPDAAAAQFVAEGEAWQSHFEKAAPMFRAVAADYPGDAEQQTRAASMYRSLATYDPAGSRKNTDIAADLEQNAAKFAPRDTVALTRTGEIYADREWFQRAKPFWNRVAAVQPGKPDGYLEAATIFWDYYQFGDALRLLSEGRKQMEDPRLFSYEAGAIYENQRDYRLAVEEYAKGALATPEDAQSRARLVTLARRPSQRAQIDELTARAAAGPNAGQSAISLRADVLAAQNRTTDLSALLLATARTNTSFDVLQYVDGLAATRGLDQVQEQCKLREVALTTDPIERMQAEIALAHFYEAKRDFSAAARTIDALYKDHPTVLGVVRAAADYYWRNKDPKRAIDVLAQAAAKAQPSYRDPFTLEAARKATDAGDYSAARTFLASLLKQDPYQSQYVAAMADTYARQGDDKALRAFYEDRLKELGQASLASSQKAERVASLRRGLIPVLTRLKDYSGGVDQYIEVLNRFPEDLFLAREAANYAAAHGRSQQLIAYYQNTEKQSPRDFRWPMIEARIQSQLEDFPAAIAAYNRAVQVRPDRTDFYVERAALDERLLHFDAAAATYAKLYELKYHNSQWMERLAAVRARQGQTEATVKALEAAFIENRPAGPEMFFAVAGKLEAWGMLPEARTYVEKGVDLAGPALLTDYVDGAQTYLRILTRLRKYEDAWQRIAALWQGQPAQTPTPGREAALRAMGTAVAQYFTPEEKSAFATFIGTRLAQFRPAIESSGLMDLQARLLARNPDRLMALQRSRLQFEALAAQLEAFWKVLPPEAPNRDTYLELAAQNYRLAGNTAAELRVLTLRDQQGGLTGPALERFAELIASNPQQLDAVASSNPSQEVRNAVVNAVLKSGISQRSFQAVAARGKGLPPVWTRAYTALTGLYFDANTPVVNQAFRDALGTATIGERLGKPVDRTQQLAGGIWFYYGSRYGEYLQATRQDDAEDYLPSDVEARPGSAEAYVQLGEHYRDSGQFDRALEQYRYVLQLDNSRIDAHDRLGAILASQGKRDESIVEFRSALNAAGRRQDERRVPESFWTDLKTTLQDIGKAQVLDAVRADAERVLRTYVRRNGDFRVEPLLESVLAAAADPAAGVAWIVDLSKAAPEPAMFLESIVNAEWIPEVQRPTLYRALLDAARIKPEMLDNLRRFEIDFATYLVSHQQPREAQTVLADLPEEQRIIYMGQIVLLEVRIAAGTNSLSALLNRYRAAPDLPARILDLRTAASDLESQGNHAASREVQEFIYTYQIESRQLDNPTFLGLAEIRLEQNNIAAAIALLRRMTMVVGEPFENLMDAANLLLRTGHAAEAVPFLEQRVTAAPWDAMAAAQLAKARGTAEPLKKVAASSDAPYEARVAAARALGGLKNPLTTASVELNLLSAPPIAPVAAEKPYFYYARVDAAARTSDPAARIRLLSGAIAVNPSADGQNRFDLMEAALNARRWQTAVAVAQSTDVPAPQSLTRRLAQAYEALKQYQEAANFYRIAKADADLKRVQAILDQQAANDLRRPVVTQNLEQDHRVRPRILAASSGGAQ